MLLRKIQQPLIYGGKGDTSVRIVKILAHHAAHNKFLPSQILKKTMRIRAGMYLVLLVICWEDLDTYTKPRNLNNTFRPILLGEILDCYK